MKAGAMAKVYHIIHWIDLMKKTLAILLSLLLILGGRLSYTTNHDWAGWEDWEYKSGHYVSSYFAPFQDASLDQIIDSLAAILADFRASIVNQQAWHGRHIAFSYSSDGESDAAVDKTLFTNTIVRLGSRIFKSSFGADLIELYPIAYDNEYQVECVVDIQDTATVNKLFEIANGAKAHSSTTRGQLEYINQYLIDHVEYGYDNITYGQTTHDAIIMGTAVCAGYTSTIQSLCFILGIPAVSLKGNQHVWNVVYVDGKWKMLDVTWNDSIGNKYFLVDSFKDSTHDITVHDNADTVKAAKAFALKIHSMEEVIPDTPKPMTSPTPTSTSLPIPIPSPTPMPMPSPAPTPTPTTTTIPSHTPDTSQKTELYTEEMAAPNDQDRLDEALTSSDKTEIPDPPDDQNLFALPVVVACSVIFFIAVMMIIKRKSS